MFRAVLVPVDGSDHAIQATALASDLAAAYGARMTLVHVISDDEVPEELAHFATVEKLPKREQPPVGTHLEATPHGSVRLPGNEEDSVDQHAVLMHVAERILDEAAGVARQHGVEDIKVLTEEGDPAKCILECARREGADAIVIGSRGLSDLQGIVMGSVSHKVAHDADRTCITVS